MSRRSSSLSVATRTSLGRPCTLITPEPTKVSTGVTGTLRPTAADRALLARRALPVDLHHVIGDQDACAAVVGHRDGVDAAGADGEEAGTVIGGVGLVI